MNRHDLALDTAATIATLNDKVREAITLGRPGDTVDYANALASAATAYDHLDPLDD